MELGCFRAAIHSGDPDIDIFRRYLGIFDEYVEIPILIEYSGVEQFVLGLGPRAMPVGFNQVTVWVGTLRVLIEPFRIGIRRRGVEIDSILLRPRHDCLLHW